MRMSSHHDAELVLLDAGRGPGRPPPATNCSAVAPICRCSSVKSSGVKTSSFVASGTRYSAPLKSLLVHVSPPDVAASSRALRRARTPPPRPCRRRCTSRRPRSARPSCASSCSRVAVSFAPVQPSGWPSAIAPPFGFTRAGSSPSARTQASACAANASFSSNCADLLRAQPGPRERGRDRLDRADPHELRRHAPHRERDEAGERRAASVRFRNVLRDDQRRRGAVGHLRGVAGGDACRPP